MSVCPSADRSAREYVSVHGLQWRTAGRRWWMSSRRSDNCGKSSSLRDYGPRRSVPRSNLSRHICRRRHEREQPRGRTCVRESYPKGALGQRASNLKPRSARSAGSIHQLRSFALAVISNRSVPGSKVPTFTNSRGSTSSRARVG